MALLKGFGIEKSLAHEPLLLGTTLLSLNPKPLKKILPRIWPLTRVDPLVAGLCSVLSFQKKNITVSGYQINIFLTGYVT